MGCEDLGGYGAHAMGDWLAPTPSRDDELAALRAKVEELRATIRGMSSTIAQQAQYISRMT